MVTPYAPPPVTDDDGAEPRSPWTTVGRIAVVAVVIGCIAMWGYAFFGHPDVPGRLEGSAFPGRAEPVCKATQDQINQLPRANQTPNATDRAAVVDQGSDALDAMLVQLRTFVPTDAADVAEADALTQWIADWQTYVNDRRDYTAQLRVDPMAQFAVTQSDRDSRQITSALDRFARVNDMASCASPADIQ